MNKNIIWIIAGTIFFMAACRTKVVYEDFTDVGSNASYSVVPGRSMLQEQMPNICDCGVYEPHEFEAFNKCRDEYITNFIYDNLKYPKRAIKNADEGMVVTSFVIDKEGKMVDIKILKGVTTEIDKEAFRILTKLKKKTCWVAGKHKDKTIDTPFNIPIIFELDKE